MFSAGQGSVCGVTASYWRRRCVYRLLPKRSLAFRYWYSQLPYATLAQLEAAPTLTCISKLVDSDSENFKLKHVSAALIRYKELGARASERDIRHRVKKLEEVIDTLLLEPFDPTSIFNCILLFKRISYHPNEIYRRLLKIDNYKRFSDLDILSLVCLLGDERYMVNSRLLRKVDSILKKLTTSNEDVPNYFKAAFYLAINGKALPDNLYESNPAKLDTQQLRYLLLSLGRMTSLKHSRFEQLLERIDKDLCVRLLSADSCAASMLLSAFSTINFTAISSDLKAAWTDYLCAKYSMFDAEQLERILAASEKQGIELSKELQSCIGAHFVEIIGKSTGLSGVITSLNSFFMLTKSLPESALFALDKRLALLAKLELNLRNVKSILFMFLRNRYVPSGEVLGLLDTALLSRKSLNIKTYPHFLSAVTARSRITPSLSKEFLSEFDTIVVERLEELHSDNKLRYLVLWAYGSLCRSVPMEIQTLVNKKIFEEANLVMNNNTLAMLLAALQSGCFLSSVAIENLAKKILINLASLRSDTVNQVISKVQVGDYAFMRKVLHLLETDCNDIIPNIPIRYLQKLLQEFNRAELRPSSQLLQSFDKAIVGSSRAPTCGELLSVMSSFNALRYSPTKELLRTAHDSFDSEINNLRLSQIAEWLDVYYQQNETISNELQRKIEEETLKKVYKSKPREVVDTVKAIRSLSLPISDDILDTLSVNIHAFDLSGLMLLQQLMLNSESPQEMQLVEDIDKCIGSNVKFQDYSELTALMKLYLKTERRPSESISIEIDHALHAIVPQSDFLSGIRALWMLQRLGHNLSQELQDINQARSAVIDWSEINARDLYRLLVSCSNLNLTPPRQFLQKAEKVLLDRGEILQVQEWPRVVMAFQRLGYPVSDKLLGCFEPSKFTSRTIDDDVNDHKPCKIGHVQ